MDKMRPDEQLRIERRRVAMEQLARDIVKRIESEVAGDDYPAFFLALANAIIELELHNMHAFTEGGYAPRAFDAGFIAGAGMLHAALVKAASEWPPE